MSEKKTSSILETIKKKLNKLEKSTESNDQPTQVDDEFQYIGSGNNKPSVALPSLTTQEEPTKKFTVAEVKASESTFDDMTSGDLDLDNEDAINFGTTKDSPSILQNSAQQKNNELNFDAIKQESLPQKNNDEKATNDSSLDWLNSEPSLQGDKTDTLPKTSETPQSEKDTLEHKESKDEVPNSENEDDFLKSLGIESEEEDAHNNETASSANQISNSSVNNDPLSLTVDKSDDLDLSKNSEELENKTIADSIETTEIGLEKKDDLDFSAYEEDENKTADSIPNMNKSESDLDFSDHNVKDENKSALDAVQNTETKLEENDDLDFSDFEDNDLEEHKETANISSTETIDNKKDEKIDSSDSDKNSKQDDVINSKTDSNNSSTSKNDELDFDDLDLEAEVLSPLSDSSDPVQKIQEQQISKEEVISQDNKAEKIIPDMKNDFDFDFESELMGNSDSSTITNSSNTNSQTQESVKSDSVIKETQPQVQKIEIMPNIQNNEFVNNSSLQVNQNAAQKILSESTVKQVSDSVKKLIDAKNIVSGVANFSQSPALAEIATQLMEPKIEKWFNDNLPELVEKIVREEIKKLIP